MLHRKERVVSLMQEELNRLLTKEAEFPLGAIVTVMRVELAEEDKRALVWVSIFPAKFRVSVQKQLKAMTPMLGGLLVRRLRMQHVPILDFRIDEGNEHADEINRLLDSIPPEERGIGEGEEQPTNE